VGNVNTAQKEQLRSAESAADLRIRLLGPLAITNGGQAVAIPSRKARALVGYLALRQGTEVSRGVLTGLLWGERSESQARASLRQTLSELRAAGSLRQSIVATKEAVTFAPGSAWIDAKVLQTLADSKDEDVLKEAAELISGDLMEGLSVGEAPYEEWLASEREHFRLIASRIYTRLMELAEHCGALEEALTSGLKLLSIDPLQERVHRALMRIYAAQGRHDAALAQYERCRRELLRELAVRPNAETEELVRTIRASRNVVPARAPLSLTSAPEPGPSERTEEMDRASIVVLPFTNLSGDPDQQYFSDGITEDIITELSRYHSLLVIARNSSFQFRGNVDVAAVRSALGVRYVAEGSVRKAGDRIRVTAQLIDALTGTQIWAERYDRESEDVFAVQDEVTRAVVATLQGRIVARSAELARRKPPADWVAYDFVLQGRECMYRYQKVEAEPFFARAAELDPAYAHAHAWRAMALGVTYLIDEREETLDAALISARKALALDDNDALCHHAMAYVALRRCEYELAGHHHERALTLNPNDTELMAQRANWLMHVGRLEEALALLDASLERDPFPPTWYWDVRGYILYHLRRYREAILAFRSVQAEPFWIAGMLAAAYGQLGQLDEARRELDRYLAARPRAALGSVADKIIYADKGMHYHWLEGLRKAGLPE
jgi:TolB-like protein/DNA-binding SARP family transcriptional activator